MFLLFLEEYVLSIKELKDEVPEEYLGHKERYENSVRKGCILYMLLMKRLLETKPSQDDGYVLTEIYC